MFCRSVLNDKFKVGTLALVMLPYACGLFAVEIRQNEFVICVVNFAYCGLQTSATKNAAMLYGTVCHSVFQKVDILLELFVHWLITSCAFDEWRLFVWIMECVLFRPCTKIILRTLHWTLTCRKS